MRAFLSIPLPKDVIELATHLRQELESLKTDIKWVEKENYHVTLKFLGEVKQKGILNIYKDLLTISETTPKIKLRTSQIGFFPNIKRPRVIWLGLNGEIAAANYLGERIDSCLVKEGYQPENKRNFHITLGRIRNQMGQDDLVDKVLRLNPEIPSYEFLADRLDFVESQLSRGGPRYILHKSFKFKG